MYLELKKSGEEVAEDQYQYSLDIEAVAGKGHVPWKEIEARRQAKTPPTEIDLWRQILFDAAGVLERKGWCQRNLVDVKGRHCVLGALTYVWNLASSWDLAVVATAQDRLAAVVGPLVEWNDTQGRTQEEVVGMLRYVAALQD